MPRFEFRLDAQTRCLALSGDFDHASALEVVGSNDIARVGPLVLDLTDVSFLDAGGLGAIVHLSRRVANGEQFRVTGASPKALKIIILGGVEHLTQGV